MNPKIIEDRLTHRLHVLRVRWHVEGDVLLQAGRYVEFADGLLRLMRQLDAIDSAVAHQSQRPALGGFGSMPVRVRTR